VSAAAVVVDAAEGIREALRVLYVPKQVVELRVPKAGEYGTISGFFDNIRSLSAAAAELSGRFPGVYVTLNPVKPELLERSPNRLTYNADKGTLARDCDIVGRRWLLVDADPARPADVSSTDAEKQAALDLARRVRDELAARGWPAPILADSGNGAHLLYRVDLPNDADGKALVQGVLKRLAAEFDTDAVKIDRKVFNASRICKVYGTLSAKGTPTDDRPHRVAALLDVPADMRPVTVEQLRAMQPVEAERPRNEAMPALPPAPGVNRYALAALESAATRIAAAVEGTRNDTLNTEAFGVFQLVAGGVLGKATAWSVIEDAAERCGLAPGEVNSTLHSAWDAAQKSPRVPPEPAQRRRRSAPPAPAVPPGVDPETGEILDTEPEPPQAANDNTEIKRNFFTVLGYDRDRFYFFPHEKRQITEMTRSDMTENGLLSLAPLEYWLAYHSKDNAGNKIDRSGAVDWLIRRAYERGVFNPHRIRGRGAWIDAGRIVVHMGSHLIVDGEHTELAGFASRHIYQAEIPLPDLCDEPLHSDEGELLLDVAGMFRWTMPASAALLAGWVALAPVCGALRWRPHIWITGGAGCGKSTILNDYVHFLMGGLDVFAQGNSSEAGIRQKLQSDALPVLFDETEQNNEREEQRVQGVLALIRQSSSESGAQTLKGTVGGRSMQFHIRSMFCLASIQVGIKQQADRERLAVLALRPKYEGSNSAGEWERLRDRLRMMARDGTMPARLFRRAIDLLPVTLRNIDTFVSVATEYFGNARDGDQYGTLLAGAWSLIATGSASRDDAREMIERYDWTEYTETNTADDASRALQALIEARIRIQGGLEYTVAELAGRAAELAIDGCGVLPSEAQAALRRHGLKVVTVDGQRCLLVSNNSNATRELVSGTQFEADLRGQLLRVPGAFRHRAAERFTGPPSKCVGVPLSVFI
jgi:hypothetical protein